MTASEISSTESQFASLNDVSEEDARPGVSNVKIGKLDTSLLCSKGAAKLE